MITIYHNPRCSKSRNCKVLLEELGKEHTVVNYTKELFTVSSLKKVLGLLKIAPIDLVRKNESIWKEQYKGKTMSDEEIIEAMVANPKLIERPIVVNGNKAAIGRPLEAVEAIL